jgi:hypothetical protein
MVEHLAAALPGWLVARAVVLGALALGRFLHDELAPGTDRPGPLGDGLLGWDAGWYADIAEDGYEALPREAVRFFPLVPLLARALAVPLGGNTGVALVLLANAAALAAGVLLYRLARAETGDRPLAARAAWLLALLPPAFVLVMGYAEAVTLVLVLGTFLLLRQRRWVGAAGLGALAGFSRPFGLLLVLPALVEARQAPAPGARPDHPAARALAVAGPLVGAGAYLAWVGATFGDWLLPFRVQEEAGRRGGFTNPLASLVDSGRHLLDGDMVGTGLHLPWAVGFLVLLVVVFRRWPLSYGVFAAATLAVALSAENLDSLERYGLGAFPLVLALASVTTDGRVERLALTAAAAGLAGYALLAFLGQYVP